MNELQDADLPFISLNMPIYNRSRWITLITANLKCFNYPPHKIELVILDDSDTDPLFKNIPLQMFEKVVSPIKVKYIKDNAKKTIGAKRNILCKNSSHNIIACMDSDDIYLPSYLRYAVNELKLNKLGAVGSAEMIFAYPFENWLLTGIKCETNRQIHEATMVYTKKHFKAMGGFAKNGVGEGAKMFDFMSDKVIKKLDCDKIMICVCHKNNTCDKELFKTKGGKLEGELNPKIIAIVEDILGISDIHN